MSEPLAGVSVSGTSTSFLTGAMALPPGAAIPRDQIADPRAEPVLVFLLGSRLAGPGLTATAALTAVSAVSGGVRVIDDQCTACYATGSVTASPAGLDLALEACLLEVDGQVVDSATGASVLGHPAQALALAASELARRDLALEPGWIVLAGGLTDAVPCPAGTSLAVHFTSLGSVFLR